MPSTLRSKIFWSLDGLRGSKVGNYFNDIEAINENPKSDSSEKRHKKHLNDLLVHARDTVAFYKNADIPEAHLQHFPVVDKNIIRENFEDFQSQKFADKKKFKVTTSGSTGTPFSVFQNSDKRKRNRADSLYFTKKVGYKIGARLFFMRIWGDLGFKKKIGNFIQNIAPIDVLRLNEEEIPDLVRAISQSGGEKSLLGYASAYERIVNYLDRRKETIDFGKVNSIVAIGEALEDATAEAVQRHFKCPIYSRYSNNENGILAQQTPLSGKNFLINTASYVFEILDMEKDVPVEDGTLGRIVVTDLFNHAMPMIRYDTGDLGIHENVVCGDQSYPVLSRIEGRKMDMVFDSEGRAISSFLFTNKMKEFTGIKQFQFIQYGPQTYEFKLNVEPSFDGEQQLIEAFKIPLGPEATIDVHYVDAIPLLSSGKRKKVVNASGNTLSKVPNPLISSA